jgi:hypothetical protein
VIELCSADTLAYEENGSCNVHAVTIAAAARQTNYPCRCVLRSGRTLGRPSKGRHLRDVVSGEWAVPWSPHSR